MSKLFRPFGNSQTEAAPVARPAANKEEPMMQRTPRDRFEPGPVYTERPELAATNLSADVEIKGSIKFNESLRLDGKFEGDLSSDSGLLIVGKNGNLHAKISVGSIIVEGKVNGNVQATDKVELRGTAQHFGDVKAARLVVEEGVVFVGKCDVNPQRNKIEPIRPQVKVNAEEPQETATPKKETSEDELQEDFLR